MNALFISALALFFAQGLIGRDNVVARAVAAAFVAACVAVFCLLLG